MLVDAWQSGCYSFSNSEFKLKINQERLTVMQMHYLSDPVVVKVVEMIVMGIMVVKVVEMGIVVLKVLKVVVKVVE